jgi:polysaccharide chain length determinant protein (PEP-CTERM system associated)
MPEKSSSLQIGYYIDLALKHRWLLIIPFCLAMVVGIYFAITLPKIYKASTLIFVEPQRVPEDFVRSIVATDIDSRINTIQQQILSRTNLEKIIKKFDLFTRTELDKLFMEEKVTNVRKRIEIDISKTRHGLDTFSISFQDTDPEIAMNVANGLATLFIDENLKVREAHALGTSDFLESELQAMRLRLKVVEANLRDYRKAHMGELPEQIESNLRMLENLQQQLSDRQEQLGDERNRLITLRNQMTARNSLLAAVNPIVSEDSPTTDAMTLPQLKRQLANLRTTYTDRHPDVIRLKDMIEDREVNSANRQSPLPETATNTAIDARQQAYTDETMVDLINQKRETELEIRDLEKGILKLNQQIQVYKRRIEQTPQREEELLSLNRDYSNIQESYNSLLNRKLEAEIAVNMEKKQKGEQFRIIDYARKPQKPVSPDLRHLFMLAVAAGLGLGGGLVFLLDFFDNSLKRPETLETDLGVPVLATVPKIHGRKDIRRRRFSAVMTSLGLIVAMGLFGGFAVLIFKGIEPILEFVQKFAGPYIMDIKNLI